MKTTPSDIYGEDGNELIRGNVKVEWVQLGEGLSEEYNPNDPTDANILRFDVSVKPVKVSSAKNDPASYPDEWVDPGNASYSTRFPVSAPIDLRKRALKAIMDKVYGHASEGYSFKKIGEEMSWLTVRDVSKMDFWLQGLAFLTVTVLMAFLALVALMVAGSERDMFAGFICIILTYISTLFIPMAKRSWRLDSDIRKIREAYPQP
jgi:hypothetical protein